MRGGRRLEGSRWHISIGPRYWFNRMCSRKPSQQAAPGQVSSYSLSKTCLNGPIPRSFGPTNHRSHFEDYYVFKKFNKSCLPMPVIIDSG